MVLGLLRIFCEGLSEMLIECCPPSKHALDDLQKETGTEMTSSLNLYCVVRTILDTSTVK